MSSRRRQRETRQPQFDAEQHVHRTKGVMVYTTPQEEIYYLTESMPRHVEKCLDNIDRQTHNELNYEK